MYRLFNITRLNNSPATGGAVAEVALAPPTYLPTYLSI